MSCRHNNIFAAVKSGHIECVRKFLNKPYIHIDITDNEGKTCLHWACSKNNLELVKFLCSGDNEIYLKADVNIFAGHNQTPLYLACRWGNIEIIKILLENGAKVNYYTYNLVSPLHQLVFFWDENSDIRSIELLLEYGADLFSRVDGRTPYEYTRNEECKKILQEYMDVPEIKDPEEF